MKDFITHIVSNRANFVNVDLNYKDINELEGSVLKSLGLESTFQLNDRYDGVSFFKKFSRKVSGVIVLEKLLGIEILNWQKINPANYKPIIIFEGKKIEVVTFDIKTFPKIPMINKIPKLFIMQSDKRKFSVCGFANTEILNKYQDINLMNDYLAKDLTAFFGFRYLIKFTNTADLKVLIDS
jgi:hypothetical protein